MKSRIMPQDKEAKKSSGNVSSPELLVCYKRKKKQVKLRKHLYNSYFIQCALFQ